MKTKHLRIIVVGAWVGCLAPCLAWAQPIITAQPSDKFLNAPGAVTFSVTATGTGLTCQWLFDATAVASATNRIFTLTNSPPAAWGCYSVIVSNASGSVTSQVAQLKVFTPARHTLNDIQAQPDGSISLKFAGETMAAFAPYYDLYPLECSSDLLNWAPLATLQRANGALNVLSFMDTNTPAFSQRFYRTPTNVLATPIAPLTGPYPVGTFSMLMTDPSRTNAAGKTNYQFMTTFWYPAVAQAGVLPAKYVESQVIDSTVHGSFVDWDLLDDPASLATRFETPMGGQFLSPARVSQIVRAYLLSFFNKFLKVRTTICWTARPRLTRRSFSS